jgi:hypothetical protein
MTTDGVTWTDVSPDFMTSRLLGAGWKDDDVIAVADHGEVLLRDAKAGWFWKSSWSTDEQRGRLSATAVVWTGKLAVAAGDHLVLISPSGNPYDWKEQPSDVPAHGNAIAFTGTRLVVVGKAGSGFVSP